MINLQKFMESFYKNIQINDFLKLKNKTVLITGASGLIGSNLISFLDYLSRNKKLNLKIIGIIKSDLPVWGTKSKNIKYLKLNLSKEKINKNINADFIIHCATYGQPKKFLEYPEETVRLNIDVLFSLLKIAETNKATFLYLSSSEVYGDPDEKNIPTSESYFGNVNTLSDRAIYAESKRLAETICYLYRNKTSIKIARVLIGYGPGIKYEDKRVIPEFIKKAQDDKEIKMMDRGVARRTLCFIADTIEMLLNIVLSSRDMVYNVSGEATVSIAELADLIASINNVKVVMPQRIKEISGTPSTSTILNKKYKMEFGKKTFVSLEEGLKITSKWIENLR